MGTFSLGHTKAARLTPVAVVEIREKYWQLGWTQGRLAREYGVNVNTIGRIVRGESWQHIGGVGMHQAATEAPAAANLTDAAHLQAAQNAPDSAESQASLQKVLAMLAADVKEVKK